MHFAFRVKFRSAQSGKGELAKRNICPLVFEFGAGWVMERSSQYQSSTGALALVYEIGAVNTAGHA